VPIVNELFNARIGFANYVVGTRVMDDVNDKLDWVREKLDTNTGERNTILPHLITVRYNPLAKPCKIVEPTLNSSVKVRINKEEPDVFVNNLTPVLIERPEVAADTMGHIWYRDVVNTCIQAAVEAGEHDRALQAQEQMVGLFKERNVVPSVITAADARLEELKGGSAHSKSRRVSR
jgi:hypothetical protein